MIDLISDTVTMPDREMLQAILTAELGDAGRTRPDGRGEDETTNRLEDMAARITGKAAAAFFPSGTMANTAALLSQCGPGDRVLVDEKQHILLSEKVCFEERYFRLVPVCCRLAALGGPDTEDVRRILETEEIRLVCIENTHNFSGGKCIPLSDMRSIYEMAADRNIRVHMDGARLFHAAEALGVTAAELCRYADSVMFCISKGLGAPIGSLLCGTAEVIKEAKEVRKMLGGAMRQSGVAAACGIYALEHNVKRLAEDHAHAKAAARRLEALRTVQADTEPQTNIVLLDLRSSGVTAADFGRLFLKHGVRGLAVSAYELRLVFHLGITGEEAIRAAEAVLEIDRLITGRRLSHPEAALQPPAPLS